MHDINTHLVKQIRNRNAPERKVFDRLEADLPYNLLTCYPDGLKNPDHWCGKLNKKIQDEKCKSNEGKFGFWKTPCEKMPEYISSEPQGKNLLITTPNDIRASRQAAQKQTQSARARGRGRGG